MLDGFYSKKSSQNRLCHSILEVKIAISTDIQEHYLLLSNLDSFQIMFYVA